MAAQTVVLSRSKWSSGTGLDSFLVSHDGRKVKIIPKEWDAKTRRAFPHGSPNYSLRHAIFNKLGLQMDSGGNLFVPRAYTERTGKTTFRGLSFRQVSALQKKY